MTNLWKTLIADDEPIIREGIIKSIDWSSLHMQVVAEAEDGEQALESAIKHQIDIALVDLNMPILNGLALISKLKDKLPSCQVIIISGFDKFQYAQEAIRFAVQAYILKPINASILTQTLKTITSKLNEKISADRHVLLAYQQIHKNLHLLKERFCIDWLNGRFTETEILDQLAFLELPQHIPQMIGVIRWLEKDRNKSYLHERDHQLYTFAMRNIIEECLKPYESYVYQDSQGLMVIIGWSIIPENLKLHIQSSIQNYLKIQVALLFEQIDECTYKIHPIYQRVCESVLNLSQCSPVVRRAQLYLQEHFADPDLQLHQVADKLQISPAYLSKQLKEEIGYSFIHLLTTLRIKQAMALLDTTNLTIHEVSQRVGYENQHYFSTSFKKNLGISPNQYRQNK